MLIHIAIGWKCLQFCTRILISTDTFHRIQNAKKCTTMYHFIPELCKHVDNSIKEWCIVGERSGSLWYMCIRSSTQTHICTRNYLVDYRSSLDDFICVCGCGGLQKPFSKFVKFLPCPESLNAISLLHFTFIFSRWYLPRWNVMQHITRHIHINRNVPVGTIIELSFGYHHPLSAN